MDFKADVTVFCPSGVFYAVDLRTGAVNIGSPRLTHTHRAFPNGLAEAWHFARLRADAEMEMAYAQAH